MRIKEVQQLRADQEYEEYRLRRVEELRNAEQQAIEERLARELAARNYQNRISAGIIAREAR
jgi:hypothetical protein